MILCMLDEFSEARSNTAPESTDPVKSVLRKLEKARLALAKFDCDRSLPRKLLFIL